MATYSFDAIEIYTDDGTGGPVAFTDASVGCSSGIFRLRTGNNTISSVSGDTSSTTWYKGILTDSGVSCSQSTDIHSGGGVATVSGMSFSIINTAQFWKTIEDAGIKLHKCKVVYYYSLSSSNSSWTFYRRWSGVIDDIKYNETHYSIRCVSVFSEIFRTIPPSTTDKSKFSNIKESEIGKRIPIAIGRVPYSPTVNVRSSGKKYTLAIVGEEEYKFAPCTAYAGTVLTIYSPGVSISSFPTSLDDLLFVTIIKGGAKQTSQIKFVSPSSTSGYLDVWLYEPLDTSVAFDAWSIGSNSPTVWYAEISNQAEVLIASENPVYEIIKNESGSAGIFGFDSDSKTYYDVSDVGVSSSEENSSATGYPGISTAAASDDDEAVISVYRNIKPSSVIQYNTSNITGVTYSNGAEMPNVIDASRSNYARYTKSSTVTANLYLDVFLPEASSLGGIDELYLLFDISEDTTSSHTSVINLLVTAIDIFGREVLLSPSVSVPDYVTTGITAGDGRQTNLIPYSYYGEPYYTGQWFYDNKSSLDISSIISDIKSGYVYNRLRLRIEFESSGISATDTVDIVEVMFVAKTAVSFIDSPVYIHQKGEVYGSTWNGRVTASDPCLTIGDAIEKIARDYGYNYNAWDQFRAYVVGDIIKPTADNKHTYRCTTAGTTGASEPTWTTTDGGTNSDGTVVWTEHDTMLIDEDSFDTLRDLDRAGWIIGKTITDETGGLEVIKELAEQGFIGVYAKPNGDIAAKAFRDYETSLVDFDETNVWDISDVSFSPSMEIHNEIKINYGYDYATKEYKRSIAVTNIDWAEFPAPNDVTEGGPNLGGFTISVGITSGGVYYFTIVTDSVHGLVTGDYVSLTDNLDSYDFNPTQITVTDTDTFTVAGQPVTSASSSSGALRSHEISSLRWKRFVSGVNTYARAKSLWDVCHESYLVTKTKQQTPDRLSNCGWLIDPGQKRLNGEYIWTDLDDSDDHPAYWLAVKHAYWSAWPKKEISFSVDRSAANLALNLYDCVTISDEKLTDGSPLTAYISGIEHIPKAGNDKEYLRLTVAGIPEDAPEPINRILDVADTANRILDIADATNRIIETPT